MPTAAKPIAPSSGSSRRSMPVGEGRAELAGGQRSGGDRDAGEQQVERLEDVPARHVGLVPGQEEAEEEDHRADGGDDGSGVGSPWHAPNGGTTAANGAAERSTTLLRA